MQRSKSVCATFLYAISTIGIIHPVSDPYPRQLQDVTIATSVTTQTGNRSLKHIFDVFAFNKEQIDLRTVTQWLEDVFNQDLGPIGKRGRFKLITFNLCMCIFVYNSLQESQWDLLKLCISTNHKTALKFLWVSYFTIGWNGCRWLYNPLHRLSDKMF